MKAIVVSEFGEPRVLKIGEVPAPIPSPKQVLVRMKAVGVNPVDTYVRAGIRGPRSFPYTPGSDGAGVVEQIGAEVKKVSLGERVYIAGSVSGAYAELSLCEEHQVFHLPEKVTFAQGAGIYVPYGTAYRALFQRANARAGETVLVHGASGGVGIAAVQFARAHGCKVIGTAGTERGLALVRQEGAHEVVNHGTPEYGDALMKLTAGRGFDIVLEMLANINLARDLALIAKGGRIIVIGNRGTIEIDPRQAMSQDASIIGMSLFNTDDAGRAVIHGAIRAGLENGTLRPIVGRELPLAEASKAHELVYEPGAFGKTVLLP